MGFARGQEEGRKMTKKAPTTLKSRNICWSHEPWPSLGAARAAEQRLALPYISSVPGERTIIQHWKQQARRASEEQMLWFVFFRLSFPGLCLEEMWGVSTRQQGGGCCTHVVVTPTHRCLGDLGVGCENCSWPLLELPGLLCGRESFQGCNE